MEEFPVLFRNTKHVANHGKIGNQVHIAPRLDAIDNAIDNGLNDKRPRSFFFLLTPQTDCLTL